MAPSPENDHPPKDPDKSDKQDTDSCTENAKESGKDEKTLSNLNDRELKALLDEAINYKNPKDREGKSELFNDLLLEAEESERIARATSAGGSEQVRHCNPAARRQRHTGGPRGRRYGGPSSSGLMGRSVSERGTHGGSLDNLAKEELYEATCRRLRGARKSSTSSSGASSSYGGNYVRVSARQREGGSLPCNVNSGEPSRDCQFLEEAKRSKAMKDKEYTVVDMETAGLLENDHLARSYEEKQQQHSQMGPSVGAGDSGSVSMLGGPKYTSKATLQISNRASNVDDPLPLDLDSAADKKSIDANTLAKVVQSKYQVIIPSYNTKSRDTEEKKVDENGNALHQTKEKKKKKLTDKNVVVVKSENIEGHKSEIIDDVQQLVQYIEGTTENSLKTRTLQSSKSRQLHKQHASEDGGTKTGKKRHSKSSGKEPGGNNESGRHELKKSNSLSEISGMKLDREFEAFAGGNGGKQDEDKVVLRTNKGSGERARERRSWGNVENLYNTSSMENLETSTENWEVTRPKKKSKKRRNSVSSATGARQSGSVSGVSSTGGLYDRRNTRALSPDLGASTGGMSSRKITRSMPHSEKSNDSSSDVDSVHSLPMDGPISYADIAKSIEKKKPSPEKQERITPIVKEKSPQPTRPNPAHDTDSNSPPNTSAPPPADKTNSAAPITPTSSAKQNVVPDVHNIKSFPAITGSITKISPAVITTASACYHVTTSTTTSDKAVQSTLSYEDNFIRERTQKTSPIGAVVVEDPPTIEGSQASTVAVAPSVGVMSLAPPTVNKRQTSPNSGTGKAKGGKEVAKGGVALQNPVQGFFGVASSAGEGQSELSLMRDPSQYASQRLPYDIPDVQTIEKMHFMNCTSPTQGATQITPQMSQLAPQGVQIAPQGVPLSPQVAQISPQVAYMPSQSAQTTPQCSMNVDANNGVGQEGARYKRPHKRGARSEEGGSFSVCDSNVEREYGSTRIVNGTSDDVFSSPEPHQPSISPPPVVILSGYSKEVPSGLVFGFDINEQLLLEDTGGGGDIITENNIDRGERGDEWARKFRPPPDERGSSKYNHEKIVSFVATAWETVVGQTIQYYSDDL